MTVSAKIKFVQGFLTPPAGEALIGVLTTQVNASNDNNANVANWQWEFLDVPPGSTVPIGIVADGNVPIYSFIPDFRGGYHLHLTVVDLAGNKAEHFLVFQVLEASGRLIPPFEAVAAALNFSGQKRGWAKYMEEWLHYLDSISAGGDAKQNVRLATNAALPAYTPSGSGVGKTLTANANGALTVDGVLVNALDRLLVKTEGAGTSIQNGIFVVTQAGSGGSPFILTRSSDFDQTGEVKAGDFLFSTEGTANADKGWELTTNNPITIDVTALTFGTFTGGTGGGAVATVANLAALTALSIAGMTDGALAYVQTLKSYFLLDLTSALATDTITIVGTSGAGRWIRIKEVTHEFWRRQATWFIDPAGSDENDGLTGGTKLKTWDELFRRWGPKARVLQNTTITLSGNHPQTAPMRLSIDPKSGVTIRIKGTATGGRVGTFTAVTVRNRATNQPYVLTDTGIGNWIADVDNRIRITTAGPRFGTLAWVDKDVGANAARFSEPNIPDAPNLFITPKIPLVTDAYVVETLSKVFIAKIDIDGDLTDGATPTIVTIEDHTLDLAGSGFSDVLVGNSASYLSISSCRFNCFYNQSFGAFSNILMNCNFTKGATFQGGTFAYILAGLIKGPTGFSAALGLFGACKVHLDNDVLVYGAFLDSGSTLGIGVAGFFDAIVGGQQNPAGSGIYTRPGCFIQQREAFTGARNIWGSGNAGYGIHVGVFGAAAPKNAPTVTGALGDARLGGSTSGLAQDPVTGAYVGPFTYSWANFSTALPAGFGGNMVQVSHNAAICLEVL